MAAETKGPERQPLVSAAHGVRAIRGGTHHERARPMDVLPPLTPDTTPRVEGDTDHE